MGSYKTKLIFELIGYGLLAGAGGALVLHGFFPDFNWGWYAAIILFFLALESIIINSVINNSNNKDKNRLVNIYMLSKTIKIVLSLTFGLIYFLIERSNNLKVFIVVYIICYLVFLFVETYVITKIEKHIKSNKNEE